MFKRKCKNFTIQPGFLHTGSFLRWLCLKVTRFTEMPCHVLNISISAFKRWKCLKDSRVTRSCFLSPAPMEGEGCQAEVAGPAQGKRLWQTQLLQDADLFCRRADERKKHPDTDEVNAKCSKNECNMRNMKFLTN